MPNGAVFLQWTRSGNTLQGSATLAFLDPSDPTHVGAQNSAFTGIVNGKSIALTFPEGLGESTSWNGTLDGARLILTYAAGDGTLTTLTFRPIVGRCIQPTRPTAPKGGGH